MIITLSNLKGGVGKSTLAIALAAYLSRLGKSVLLVDADPQESAADWNASRPENLEALFDVIARSDTRLYKDIPPMAAKYDYCVIDSPPKVTDVARAAILAADLVLVPSLSSNFDAWAVEQAITMLSEAEMIKPDLKACLVRNRVKPNTKMDQAISAFLEDADIHTLHSVIGDRTAFAQSSGGYSLYEVAPNSKAVEEVETVAAELMKFAGLESW